jgi:hypothetical protein
LIGQNQVSADPDAAPVSDHAVTIGRMDEITLTTTQLARLAEYLEVRAWGACRNDSIIQSRQGARRCDTGLVTLEPAFGDAPDCTHAACPGFFVDDMFMEPLRCSCGCHRIGSLLTRLLASLAR